MLTFIKKLFVKKNQPKSIGITTYPDKIIFISQYQIKNTYWISSAEIEILEINVSNDLIGKMICKQLSLSRYGRKMPNEIELKEIKEKQNKIFKFKSIKDSMKNAKHIGIIELNGKIIFEPSINGGSIGKNRGYSYLKEKIEVEINTDSETLGETYRKALEKCQ